MNWTIVKTMPEQSMIVQGKCYYRLEIGDEDAGL